MKLRKALNKIDTKAFERKPGDINGNSYDMELIDKRIKQSKTFAEISYNMLRGERVRKSWMKDAEKNRFLRKDKIGLDPIEQSQTADRRRKTPKSSQT